MTPHAVPKTTVNVFIFTKMEIMIIDAIIGETKNLKIKKTLLVSSRINDCNCIFLQNTLYPR